MTQSSVGPTKLSSRFARALAEAFELHRNQERKGSRVPYVGHLLGTAALALHFGGDEDQAVAALLHDAVEDQGGLERLAAIRSEFGDRVAGIVEGCSDSTTADKPPWRKRKEAYVESLARKGADVLLVSAADKLDNARAIVTDLRVQGEELWSRFGAGRQVLWYYRALVDAFRARVRELGEGREPGLAALVQELALTVDTMERMAEPNAG